MTIEEAADKKCVCRECRAGLEHDYEQLSQQIRVKRKLAIRGTPILLETRVKRKLAIGGTPISLARAWRIGAAPIVHSDT